MAGYKIGEIDFGEGSFGNPANLFSDRDYHYAAILSGDRTRAIIGRVARGATGNGGVCRTVALGSNRAQGIALAADPTTGHLLVETCALQDNGARHGEVWDTELALNLGGTAVPTPTPAPTGNAPIVAEIIRLAGLIT